MNADLEALYQSIILDHYRKPRNHGEVAGATTSVEGRNPLCGDQVTLWLKLDGDRIADIGFKGEGCAISRASASVMTQAVKGKTVDEAEKLFTTFHDLVTGKIADEDTKPLGQLAAFSGVSRFPMRVKCASMAWHALHNALTHPGASHDVVIE